VTAPSSPAARRRVRYSVILSVALAVIVLLALLTPEQETGRSGDPRLSSVSKQSLGAQGFYELAERLGWKVSRRYDDTTRLRDPNAAHLVLAPTIPLSALETHALLENVRAGGALLYVMPDFDRGPLEDSLHVRQGRSAYLAGTGERCPTAPRNTSSIMKAMWPDGRAHLWSLRWRENARPPLTVFALLERDAQTTPERDTALRSDTSTVAAAGFEYGRGRIVLIADADLVRNDVLRVCSWGADMIAVRMFEYLGARRLVFDEYHQGRGVHPGTLRGIGLFLTRSAAGHAMLQLAAAGLIMLLALGPRALPPTDPERVERRSPLEHVEALARAYLQVCA
jgi:hypothetical protein